MRTPHEEVIIIVKMGYYAKKECKEREIELCLGDTVAKIAPTFVKLKSTPRSSFRAADMRANPLAYRHGIRRVVMDD
jgi:hypothetical protein